MTVRDDSRFEISISIICVVVTEFVYDFLALKLLMQIYHNTAAAL